MTQRPQAMGAYRLRDFNRVLALLVACMLVVAATMGFVTQAPNRLLSGVPLMLGQGLGAAWWLAALPFLALVCAMVAPQRRATHVTAAIAASLLLAALLALAGAQARAAMDVATPLARTSFGGAFWVMALAALLAVLDAVQRLGMGPGMSMRTQLLAGAIALLPALAVVTSGALDEMSLMKEYANRSAVFHDAVVRHIVIVASALLPTLTLGLPLGAWAQRHACGGARLLAALGVVQTVPSIALFALLIAPLTALGLPGVGLLPAVVALVLYSLLPIVRSTATGLASVPESVLEAALAMGMSPRQRFWKVQWPIALPLVLSGVRVCTVQAIGLTVVAALIGAGGLGAIVFQGLLGTALDLVLLGVLPVVALALLADAVLRWLADAAAHGKAHGAVHRSARGATA